MSHVTLLLFLLTAYLEVFFECWFDGFRYLLGAQINLLPALMVYAGLTSGLSTIVFTALWGGLLFDSLSINPFGVSVLPLLAVGGGAYYGRDFILRDQLVAQLLAGAVGTFTAALLSLMILGTLLPAHPSNIPGLAADQWRQSVENLAVQSPSLNITVGMKLAVLTAVGALATPAIFRLFDFFNRMFNYATAQPTSFRTDRQIIRGRR